jgi:hypothetical protein
VDETAPVVVGRCSGCKLYSPPLEQKWPRHEGVGLRRGHLEGTQRWGADSAAFDRQPSTPGSLPLFNIAHWPVGGERARFDFSWGLF